MLRGGSARLDRARKPIWTETGKLACRRHQAAIFRNSELGTSPFLGSSSQGNLLDRESTYHSGCVTPSELASSHPAVLAGWNFPGLCVQCGRPKVPSRPGEFHPESLTEPDLILSHHPARAIARRLPPSAESSGSSRFNPVGPCSTAMTRPLCSTGITPLRRYYEAVRPSPAHRYFRPRGWSRLRLFPWHRRPGSHVPYKSQIELRAAYMPDAAWAVSVHPPS
jgi:hypothetical protein